MITVTADARRASYTSDDLVTSGSVGIPVTFKLSDDFTGLANIAVFRGSGVTKEVALFGDTCAVPHECVATAGEFLQIGIYGHDGSGAIVIPTVWAGTMLIRQGVTTSLDPAEPTPDWAAQVQQAAAEAVAASENAVSIATEARDAATAAQDSATASAQAAATSAESAAESAQSAAQAVDSVEAAARAAASSATEAAQSAGDALDAADRAEQAAGQAGYMFFHIDERGHLIYQRTSNVLVDFYLQDGHLYMKGAA